MGELIETPRLSLRRPVPADIDALHRIHADRRACAHNPTDSLRSRAEAEDRFRHWDGHWTRYGFGYWTVHSRVAAEPIGFCGIKVMRLHGRTILNLFYRLDPDAWGDGVATEAATVVVAWAAEHGPGHPLVARVRPDNTASLRVAARAGLCRAPHLDTEGEDGLDLIFERGWSDL